MGRIEIRYLVERHQKRKGSRFYWIPTAKLQAAGFLPRRLSDDPLQAAQQAEMENSKLDAWYAGEGPRPSHLTDGLHALDELFQRDDDFREAMKPRTQQDYLYNIKAALDWADGIPASQITAKAVRAWYRSQRTAHGVATSRNRMAALRRLMRFGVTEGWITINPATGLRVTAPASRHRVWTLVERDGFCNAARQVERPSMALAVMPGWCLGQRPADLRTLAWPAYDGRTIGIGQAKTDQPVAIPALPELRALVETTSRVSTQMAVSENTQRPYRESDFQHIFAAIRNGAGLPADLQFRDLRRTLATAPGAAGCSDDRIRSITGHQTREVVAVYVRPNDAFAKGAMGRLQRAQTNGKRNTS